MDEQEELKPETEQVEEDEKLTTEALHEMIVNKDIQGLRETFLTVQDADIAEAADELETTDLIYIFRSVPSSSTASFFDYLNQDAKENLIAALTDKELVKIINEQAADDVTDFVGEMPANLARRVLLAAKKDMREDINRLLNYKEGTAGSIMTTEYLEFIDTMKVDEAIEAIREKGKGAETIYTIFVRDRKRDFVGTVDLDNLIFASKTQRLSEIMNKDVVSCSTLTDQEEVAKMFRRYDLSAMAVLNEDHKLAGIITVDDAVDVMTAESQEDLARLTNMEPSTKSYMDMSAWENAKKCIPWLIALLVLGTFTTMILNRLESQAIFTTMAILTAFVPTLMDTGGNAGGQTTGLMIRGLAVDDFGPKDWAKILLKEFRSALIVGAMVGAFAFLWITIEQYTGIVNMGDISGTGDITNPLNFDGATIWNGRVWTAEFTEHALIFSGLVALTMFCSIVAAKLIGTLLPIGAAAIKKDPALLSQPLLTTVMDAATLVIYFVIACAFFPAYA
ncbi:MAG: magnesium transporter [Bacillota bacterium]|nr:magnesium transporter [Bacillota bacterium]